MPTIQDVALRAKVSVTTVSNVLNGRTDRMSKETLARIGAAIAELNYRPSKAARQLKTGQAQVFGVLVPSITNPMFASLAHEIEVVAKREYGYRVFLGNTYRQREEETIFLEDLLAHGVRGVIVVSSLAEQSHFKNAIDGGLIMVNYDRRSQEDHAGHINADNVSMNNFEAGRIAAQCLIDSGCRRLAFVTPGGRTISRRDKIDGFRAAAAAAGIAAQAEVIEGSDRSGYGDAELPEVGGEMALRIAALATRPDGIVAINDMLAISLIAGLRKSAIRVPDDVSVVGIDDMILSSLVSPPITTVRQPLAEMARLAVTRLMARLADPSLAVQDFLFTPTLVVRESVLTRRSE